MFINKIQSRFLHSAFTTIVILAVSASAIFAQNVKVKGTVTDSKGEPVLGASILVKGTKSGVGADIDGKFTIEVPANAILIIKAMSYKDAEIPVKGRTSINVVLQDDAIMLNSAVITAEFGMKRVARAVGSAVQSVKASDVQESGRESFVSALQGRVSGITVTSTGGAPGASTNVVLRNITSISGNNQPLYVINGVPMNNSTFDPSSGFAVADAIGTASMDFASRGNDLNPDDIESMTILKGAAAAALYGSDASNGAIIITTKKGAAGRGKVSYSNSFRFDKAYGYPTIQKVYSNGSYGTTNYYYQSYFGAKYPEGIKLYDNIKSVLQTGFSQTHNVSVEGGSDKITVRGGVSYLDQKGVVKTTDFTRLNITLGGQAKITKWLDFDANMGYTETTNTKANKGVAGPLYRATHWPVTDDMSNYLDADGLQMRLPYLYTDTDLLNPLFALYKNKNYDKTNRLLTTLGFKVTPNRHTFIRTTLGWDYSASKYDVFTNPYYANRNSSSYGEGGSINTSKNNLLDKSLNIIAGYNNEWGKFTFTAQVGYHQTENSVDRMSIYGSKFIDVNFYSIANCDPSTLQVSTRNTKRRIQAISGSAEVGYNNMAFVTFRARNDWSSTLPKNNNSYFYPAVEGSFIMTELPLLKNNDWISYLKVRGAFAQVGKDASPLAIYPSLETTDNIGGGYKYGYYGPNEKLKPEMTTSYEVGFEGRFLNDRINADFTYFWTKCNDQYITGFRLSYATGFVLNNMNVGTFKTWGWESHIDGDVLRTASGLRWNLGLNISSSGSRVTSLPKNVSEYYNAYTWLSGNLRNGISVGHPVTTMTGKAYSRNKNGDILINPSTGLPIIDADWSILGDRQPKLQFGIVTSLSYKGFRFSALFGGRLGATVVNATKREMMGSGTSMESVKLRETGAYVFKGVLKNGQENSDHPTVNTIAVTFSNYGSGIYTGGDEDWLEKNVNYLRLQECRLSYTIPKKWLASNTKKFVSTASLWIAGTDLFTLTNYSGIDAVGNSNSAALGGSGGIGIDYWGIPTPRGFSFGVNLTF